MLPNSHHTHRFAISRRTVFLAAAALTLAACANTQAKTADEVVAQRAGERWAALVDGDFDKAWEYTQPGYRAVVKQRDYYKRFGESGEWKDAKVDHVECKADRCTVRVRLTVSVNLSRLRGQKVESYLDEEWVREDGQWWYYQAF